MQSSCSEEHVNKWKVRKGFKRLSPEKSQLIYYAKVQKSDGYQLSILKQRQAWQLKQQQFCTQPTSFCLILLVLASCSGNSSNFLLKFFRSSSLTMPFSFWFNVYASAIFLLHSLLSESWGTTETEWGESKQRKYLIHKFSVVRIRKLKFLTPFCTSTHHCPLRVWSLKLLSIFFIDRSLNYSPSSISLRVEFTRAFLGKLCENFKITLYLIQTRIDLSFQQVLTRPWCNPLLTCKSKNWIENRLIVGSIRNLKILSKQIVKSGLSSPVHYSFLYFFPNDRNQVLQLARMPTT